MTKTFTTKNSTSSQPDLIENAPDEEAEQHIIFYNSIKPQLNKLVKNPSEETIEKILAYAKKK